MGTGGCNAGGNPASIPSSVEGGGGGWSRNTPGCFMLLKAGEALA